MKTGNQRGAPPPLLYICMYILLSVASRSPSLSFVFPLRPFSALSSSPLLRAFHPNLLCRIEWKGRRKKYDIENQVYIYIFMG